MSPNQKLVAAALAEDLGDVGDLTAQYFVPGEDRSTGWIVSKAPGVLAGLEIATEVFRAVDGNLEVELLREDGAVLAVRDRVLQVSGSTRSILTAERTALNFLQRLSGVATMTKRFMDAVEGTDVRILDTRKTTPGWRALEKAAVLAGGGTNHRMGLYDQVMVKDNHLLAESETEALQNAIDAVKNAHDGVKVELETDTLAQVERFLELRGVDIILLDNMSNDQLAEAVRMNDGRVELEASGGVNLETVEAIARTGVDSISVGALTHSAGSLDLSMTLSSEND